MIGLAISCFEGNALLRKIVERLTFCRNAECINACWTALGNADTRLRIRQFDGKDCEIVTSAPPVVDGQDPVLNVKWMESNTVRQSDLRGDPLQDPIVFEDLFLLFHHLNFGLCRLKNRAGFAPLARLEKVEAIVEDLMRAAQMPDNDCKRKKTDLN